MDDLFLKIVDGTIPSKKVLKPTMCSRFMTSTCGAGTRTHYSEEIYSFNECCDGRGSSSDCGDPSCCA